MRENFENIQNRFEDITSQMEGEWETEYHVGEKPTGYDRAQTSRERREAMKMVGKAVKTIFRPRRNSFSNITKVRKKRFISLVAVGITIAATWGSI